MKPQQHTTRRRWSRHDDACLFALGAKLATVTPATYAFAFGRSEAALCKRLRRMGFAVRRVAGEVRV